jgi:putative tricarboxylic transport membrane protein
MLESTAAALQFLFTPSGVLFLCLGVVVGLAFGVMPGLGGTTAIALLMPLTFTLEANQAMLLMGGIMGAVSAGGSVSAILINTPGTAPNAATCFDGYRSRSRARPDWRSARPPAPRPSAASSACSPCSRSCPR